MNKEELMAKRQKLEKELEEVIIDSKLLELKEKGERYGDKFTCQHCKYRAVRDFRAYCYMSTESPEKQVCKIYEPDNELTSWIKDKLPLFTYKGEKWVQDGYLSADANRAITTLVGSTLRDSLDEVDKKKIIDILKILYEVE